MDIILVYKENREIISYLLWGVAAVIFNIVSFFLLDLLKFPIVFSNSVAFVITILFAYFTNTKYVFRSSFTLKNFTQFFTMRIGTIIIDNLGLVFIISLGANKLISKLVVNGIIIVINYIISKFLIYKKK